MLTTLAIIMPVFLLILAGFGARKLEILGPGASAEINRYVTWLALPALVFSIVATTDWKSTWHTGFVIVSVGGSFTVFALGLLIGKLRGLNLGDRSVDGLNASFSNSAYIGLPLTLLLFGPESQPFVAISATLTLILLTIATLICLETARHKGQRGHVVFALVLRGLLKSPMVLPPLLALIWWMTGIPLPTPIATFLRLLGSSASPAALVSIGLFLAARPILPSLKDRNALALATVKLLVHPAITALLALPLLHLPRNVAVLAITIAALPTGTGPFMIAHLYARDGKVTSGTILLTTTVSVVTITILMALLGHQPGH